MFNILWDESTNQDLLAGTLEELFNSTDREKLMEFPEIFKDLKTSEYYIRKMRIAGLPHGGRVGDGESIPTYDPVYDSTKDYTQLRYGSGFTITRMMKKFNQYPIYEQLTRDLKKTMFEMKDIEVAKLINTPTATTYGAGFDTLCLLHNSHTCLDTAATTYDNLTTADLSVTSLEDAYVYFDTLVDDQGKTMPASPSKLVVPPQSRFLAQQLLGSDKVPFSFENTKNVFPQWDLSLFIYHRMTDADAWFLLDFNNPAYGLFVLTSQDPDINVQDAPNTSRNTFVTSEQMFTYGIADPRCIYGAVPA